MQSMPISKTANLLYPYMPQPTNASTASSVVNILSK